MAGTRNLSRLNSFVLKFSDFINEWEGYGQHAAPGNMVKVHKPGHEMHGRTLKVVRRQPVDAGCEDPHSPGKLHWFNTGELHKA